MISQFIRITACTALLLFPTVGFATSDSPWSMEPQLTADSDGEQSVEVEVRFDHELLSQSIRGKAIHVTTDFVGSAFVPTSSRTVSSTDLDTLTLRLRPTFNGLSTSVVRGTAEVDGHVVGRQKLVVWTRVEDERVELLSGPEFLAALIDEQKAIPQTNQTIGDSLIDLEPGDVPGEGVRPIDTIPCDVDALCPTRRR